MGDDLRFRPSRTIAPLLASAIILLLGTSFCVAMLIAFDEGRPVPLAIVIGAAVGFGILLWTLRDRPTAEKRSWFAWVLRRDRQAEQNAFRVAVIRHKQDFGTKRPPTLEELRDIKDPTRTWVPNGQRASEREGSTDA